MTILKAFKHKAFHNFWVCQKKNVEFTDLTHTIYWPAKTDKKDNLSTYVSTKYIRNNVCVYWHFPNEMHNIYTIFALFTDHEKNKKVTKGCNCTFYQYKNQR